MPEILNAPLLDIVQTTICVYYLYEGECNVS